MELITGIMKSGKSTLLLQKAKEINAKGIPFAIIKSSMDTRDYFARNTDISELSKLSLGCFADEKVKMEFLNRYEYIFVDEVQFLKPEFLDKLIARKLNGAKIILAGLLYDVNQKLWSYFETLSPYLSSITILKATCDCCKEKEAIFQKRFGEVISDDYNVYCFDCNLKNLQ